MSLDAELLWTSDRLYELMHRLANRGRLPDAPCQPVAIDPAAVPMSIQRAASAAGVEVRPAPLKYPVDARALRTLGPALAQIGEGAGVRFLGVLGCRGARAAVVAPTGVVVWLPADEVGDLLARTLWSDASPSSTGPAVATGVEQLMRSWGAGIRPTPRVRRRLLEVLLRHAAVDGVWAVLEPPHGGLVAQLGRAGVARRFGLVVALDLLRSLLLVLSWWLLGKSTLDGALTIDVAAGWALVMASAVAVSILSGWLEGLMILDLNGLYRRRILHGALALEPDTVRSLGAAELLSRATEAEALDALAVSVGLTSLLSLIDLVTTAGALALIPGGLWTLGPLVAWLGFVAFRARRLYLAQRAWVRRRIAMGESLVEGLAGRRTRIAQTHPSTWHDETDRRLADLVEAGARADRSRAGFAAVSTNGWLVVAMAGLIPSAALGQVGVGAMAATLGCVLLSLRALQGLSSSLESITDVVIAWEQSSVLSPPPGRAPQGIAEIAELEANLHRRPRALGEPVLEATGLRFAYPGRGEQAIAEIDLDLRAGQKVLIEGRSGCGKTTLASVLAGLRAPGGGTVLLRGFDRETLGPREWARRVAYAPQFKDNHLFAETLLFNLLLGRAWPPTGQDVDDAYRVCEELGLRALIERMPSRLLQVVGETGWKLSHGERARVFLARALLQRADVVILDEAFAALDPTSVRQCLLATFARAPTLILIAHP